MWAGSVAWLQDRLHRSLEHAKLDRVKTALASIWIQNSPPAVRHGYDEEQLCELIGVTVVDAAGVADHPLAPYVRVRLVATLDSRAVLDAWKALEASLRAEADEMTLGEDHLDIVSRDALADALLLEPALDEQQQAEVVRQAQGDALETLRAEHVRDGLAAAFPGITVEQGTHLRIR